jgi:hypothetical protein
LQWQWLTRKGSELLVLARRTVAHKATALIKRHFEPHLAGTSPGFSASWIACLS